MINYNMHEDLLLYDPMTIEGFKLIGDDILNFFKKLFCCTNPDVTE